VRKAKEQKKRDKVVYHPKIKYINRLTPLVQAREGIRGLNEKTYI